MKRTMKMMVGCAILICALLVQPILPSVGLVTTVLAQSDVNSNRDNPPQVRDGGGRVQDVAPIWDENEGTWRNPINNWLWYAPEGMWVSERNFRGRQAQAEQNLRIAEATRQYFVPNTPRVAVEFTMSEEEAEYASTVFGLVNDMRKEAGLLPLRHDQGLEDVALFAAYYRMPGLDSFLFGWEPTNIRGVLSPQDALEVQLNRTFSPVPEHLLRDVILQPNMTRLAVGLYTRELSSDDNPFLVLIFGTETETALQAHPYFFPRLLYEDPSAAPQSAYTLPRRRLTDAERRDWIAEYNRNGGPTAFELEVVRLVNVTRASYGLSQVQIDNTLMQAARYYSQIMAEHNQLGHRVGPYGGSREVVQAFGSQLRWNAGNGIGILSTPQQAVDRWLDSPGHRRFLLAPEHRFVGFGGYMGDIASFGYLLMRN